VPSGAVAESASTAVAKPCRRRSIPAAVSIVPASGRLTPRTERTPSTESTISAGASRARADSSGSFTAASAVTST